MKRIVGFVRHRQDATDEERASTIEKINAYAQRTGATVVRTFEVPPNVASEQAHQVLQQMFQFVKEPFNVVSKVVLPSMRDLPRGWEALAALTQVRKDSHVDVALLDLGVESSESAAFDWCLGTELSSHLRAHHQSECIKAGMRRAKERRGGRA